VNSVFVSFLSFFIVLPAGAAGLGINPFEKNSPTSAGKPQETRPTAPSSLPAPKPPAPVIAPQPKPPIGQNKK
jgi:hypothetical protein